MTSDGEALTTLMFEEEKGSALLSTQKKVNLPIFKQTWEWLDIYFEGLCPDFTPLIRLEGTPFALRVWSVLEEISYGQTMTYKEIADRIAREDNRRMSAQAVGGAVGRNPISLIVPCHRVIGTSGQLVGYAGGLYRKQALLDMEKAKSPMSQIICEVVKGRRYIEYR